MRALFIVRQMELSQSRKNEKALLRNSLARLEDALDKISQVSCTREEALGKQIDFVRQTIKEHNGVNDKEYSTALCLKLAKLECDRISLLL